jgi:MerR family transcriptional regulator, thiopeptide resistance regulator
VNASYTVGQVAHLSGVTVRTLHHYDEIGLLSPTERTSGGYRVYTDADLERLRRILFYRELGFALDEIATILADPASDAAAHLRRQHRLLRERIERLQAMVAALEKEMEAYQMGMQLTPEEQFEVFGTDKVGGEWAEEAEQRWGDTDEFRESQRRAATYSKADWVTIKEEGDAGLRRFVDAMQSGQPADAEPAMDLAEAHRRYISRWFYDCGYEMHRGLATMYISDERFTKTYDDAANGLARYVHDAIMANAARHGA